MYLLKNRLIQALQSTLGRAGFQLVSGRRMAAEAELLAALLAEAAPKPLPHTKGQPMATGVVFSFNRPMQLELLLRSYYALCQNPQPLIVQYGAKGEAEGQTFAAAYQQLAALYPQVVFVPETRFRETLQTTLGMVKTPHLFFLVDDIVFTRPTDMLAFGSLNPRESIPTLRLAPTLGYSYTTNAKAPPPAFTPAPHDMLKFNWFESPHEWSYPMSVDGHLFDTAEIQVLSRILPYKAPNSYEGALMRMAQALGRRPGLCFATPRILNNPCNKVQAEVANRAGCVTPESLLSRWNNDERIALEPFLNYPNTAPHVEIPLTFEPQTQPAKENKSKSKKKP